MSYARARLSFALLAPLALAACDDAASLADGGDIEFRGDECEPNCGGGGSTNTSYAGDWPLANINTAFGVHATNWNGVEATTVSMTSAGVEHNGAWRTASSVYVTQDGELRLVYRLCSAGVCTDVTVGGAAMQGARLYFSFYENGNFIDSGWVAVRTYTAETIHGKPGHIYELTSTKWTPTKYTYGDGEYALCNANSAGEDSKAAVFIPGMRLQPNTLSILSQANGAIIACKTGADGKLVLNYGYHQTDFGTATKWTAGLKMTTADICGDGNSRTSPGRMINIQDSSAIRSWSGDLVVREGDYNHTGMICRGEAFRGPDGYSLEDLEPYVDCLDAKPLCSAGLTPPAAGTMTFGVKVQGPTP